MKGSLILIAAACLLFACGAGRVLADPMEWTTSFADLSPQNATHEDADPYKGSALVTVTNDTDQWWTDFHFEIFSVGGSNISETVFVDGVYHGPDQQPERSDLGHR